jgi:hypothetical protein
MVALSGFLWRVDPWLAAGSWAATVLLPTLALVERTGGPDGC